MLQDTAMLYSKYRYFLHVLSDERLMLFNKKENLLDFELFFEFYNFVIYKHWQLKPIYKSFKTRRSQMIKKFNHGKHYILLRQYFCHDLVELIISFI